MRNSQLSSCGCHFDKKDKGNDKQHEAQDARSDPTTEDKPYGARSLRDGRARVTTRLSRARQRLPKLF